MPKRGVAYTFTRGLYDAATGGKFRVNPTIVAGDFKLSKDNGAMVNLTTLPVVSPAGSQLVRFQLTAAEMTADRLTLVGVDQAGGEWTEYMEHFELGAESTAALPSAVQVADAVLTRDWTAVATPPAAFSIWNSLRALRNAWTIVPGSPATWHIKTENGNTDAWVRNVQTDEGSEPITGVS
jgi:hypothetical protein